MKVEMTAEAAEKAKEILNICMKRPEHVLGIISSGVSIKVAGVNIYTVKEIVESPKKEFEESSATIGLSFTGDLAGIIAVSFPMESAAKLVMAISGENAGTPELDRLRIATLREVGGIVISGIMGSIGNVLDSHMDYTVPSYEKGSIASLLNLGDRMMDSLVLIANVSFTLHDLNVESNILMVLEEEQLKLLLDKIKEILS